MKMDVFGVYTRLVLVTLVIFGAFQLSESFTWTKRPKKPTVVVEGTDASKRVSLIWEFAASAEVYSVTIWREKPGEGQTQIVYRPQNVAFSFADQSFKQKYEAKPPATLVLKDVKRNEEYKYIIRIASAGGQQLLPADEVTIDVVVPPKITVVPKRDPRLNTGQNFTLSCNASGDPTPNITWTKDGLPVNQFNASGPVLHFVKVQRKDAGSYRCTASNGYGNDVTRVSIVGIRCSDCQTKRVGIKIRSEDWDPDYSREASSDYNTLESKLLSAIFSVYSKNPGKQLYGVDVVNFREGSVDAIVELLFGKSITDPLKPLQDEINDGKLGSFTVDKSLDLNPTTPPPVTSTLSTTAETQGTPSTGARTSGLTTSEMWGIIGGCIAFVLLIVIIILICCICKKKKSGGASKGGKSYTEADGYRMNRQPPPSGLGTASPAYVEARQYAPVTAARKQDDQSKPPLNYADLSFNNSSAPGRQPPRYSGTEYSEMSPEKRPPPAGGQQGEGGGFELWC